MRSEAGLAPRREDAGRGGEHQISWSPLLGPAGVALALLVAAGLAAMGARPSAITISIAASWFPYALLFVPRLRPVDPRVERIILALAAVVAGGLALGPSALSDDLYRYVWDGRVLLSGCDPYAYAPDAPALAPLRDELFSRINHPELPTVYPPVAMVFFSAVAPLGAHGPKLLGVLSLAALVVLAGRLAGEGRATAVRSQVAMNPLLLVEGAMGGHVDLLAAAFACAALLVFLPLTTRDAIPDPWRRVALATVLALLSAGTKLLGILLVPVMLSAVRLRDLVPSLRPKPRGTGEENEAISPTASGRAALGGAIIVMIGTFAIVACVSRAGYAEREMPSGLGQYASRWEGNAGAYTWLRAGVEKVLVRTHERRYGQLVDPFPRVLRTVAETPLDPRRAFAEEKKAPPALHLLHESVLGPPLARALALLIFAGVALGVVFGGGSPIRALRRLALVLVLLAPQIHPWYLALAITLEVVIGGAASLAFGAAVLVAYMPLDGWSVGREWMVSAEWIRAEHVLVLSVWFLDRIGRSCWRRTPRD